MNHVLLFERDFIAEDTVVLRDYRFEHLTKQLQPNLSSTIKVGLLNGLCGAATVKERSSTSLTLTLVLDTPPPKASPLRLVLALPRPKVFRRVLRSAVEHGVKEIHLINSWRVEKSYWQSPLLSAQSLQESIYEGLSIAKDTVPPVIKQHKLFKPFTQDQLPQLVAGQQAYLAHPSETACPSDCRQNTWLAIGPEGGFNAYEVSLLNDAGFQNISLGPRILRVENAVSAALGRMNPI